MRFSDLHLAQPLLRSLEQEGYERPTPIQSRAIPPVLEGRDVLGIAQTGTGKTAAFALPILHRLETTPVPPGTRRIPRVLVVAPTRELAAQIGDSFRTYGRNLHFRTSVVFGGVGQRPQEDDLRRGVDILVACPGRLLDLIGQRVADLSGVETLVLDEADRMMDMGFLPDIKRIIKQVPGKRQTLFFSATMPPEIRELADGLLDDPITVAVAPAATAAETVDQSMASVEKDGKPALLENLLADVEGRALVFTRTKHGADRVCKRLDKAGIRAMAIHGDKSQGARTKALDGFRDGSLPVLVASDIAARGLDIDEIRLVVNYDIPADPDTYVHRIGRTGRAGATGRAITFVTSEDSEALRDIEKRIGRPVPWLPGHEGSMGAVRRPQEAKAKPQPRGERKDGRSGQSASKRTAGGESSRGSNAGRSGGNRGSERSSDRTSGRSSERGATQEGGNGARRRRNCGRGERDSRSGQGGSRNPASATESPKTGLIGRIWGRITGGK
ncbi:MAG TPA: DEAD/DEAH box helicase [Fibrobacteria bacterium]|nr:DEAD/DEAH box helicase [Fibrobacteria bacterium]